MTKPSHPIDTRAAKAKRLPEDQQLAIIAPLLEMLDEPYSSPRTSWPFCNLRFRSQ